MQDQETKMRRMLSYKLKELMYPINSSYKANTGGRLKNLRTTCSNIKVKEYHKKYYHLKNTLITVCGIVDHKELLNSIQLIEEQELFKVTLFYRVDKYFYVRCLKYLKDLSNLQFKI